MTAKNVARLCPYLLCAVLLCAIFPARAAQYEPGAEVRGYPSGVIFSGSLGTAFGDNYYGALSASYNVAERGNNGDHDHEDGGGFGGGLTIDKYFRSGQVGWFVGGRAELFFLNIDFRDDPGIRGDSDIVVFQPTARGGYAWVFGGGRYGLQLGLSAGAEINVHTRGENVGDGAIVLGGIGFTFRP